jgi:xanthine dehydrogenase YagS FAD-binding subunit
MAVGMAVLEATVEVLGTDGTSRRIPFHDLYRLPGEHPEKDTVLEPGDLVTAVELADQPVAACSTYLKVRDRSSFAFALVSVSAAIEVEAGRVVSCRLAFGGVAHGPWRAHAAEAALVGGPTTAEAYAAAADLELAAARPVVGNEFKVPMLRGAVVEALTQLVGEGS